MVRTFACLAALVVLLTSSVASAQLVETDRLKINGFISVEYLQQFGDEEKGDGDPHGSFDMNLFDLIVNVLPLDNVRLAADLSWEHGPQTEDNAGSVNLAFAFVEYEFDDLAKLRAGKFFVPFGIYNELHDAEPAWITVNEPRSTNKNTKFGTEFRFFPRWGTGLEAVGNGHWGGRDWDYALLVSNGAVLNEENSNQFEEDDNSQKAFTARLRFWPLESLHVGASFYSDVMTEYDDEGEATSGRTDLISYGAEAVWKMPSFGVELEYVAGSYELSTEDEVQRYGLSALLYYGIKDRFIPYFEIQYYEPDTDASDDEVIMFVYGIHTKVTPDLHLKLELNTVSAGNNNADLGDGKNHFTEFLGAIVYSF